MKPEGVTHYLILVLIFLRREQIGVLIVFGMTQMKYPKRMIRILRYITDME